MVWRTYATDGFKFPAVNIPSSAQAHVRIDDTLRIVLCQFQNTQKVKLWQTALTTTLSQAEMCKEVLVSESQLVSRISLRMLAGD